MSRDGILEGCEMLPLVDADEPERKPRGGKNKRGKSRKAGRFAVLNDFVDFSMADLGSTDRAVWLVLYRDTKQNGTACTGQTSIAARAGVSVRTVSRAVRRLERLGLLVVVRRGARGSGPSTYRVLPQRNEIQT